MDYDFDYEMESIDGYYVNVYGYFDGHAFCEYFDFDSGYTKIKQFDTETQAYMWAYKRGYRE